MNLRPMRWWDIAEVAELERRLFPDEPWSTEAFWAELALGSDRLYLVAEDEPDADTDDAELVGYAGLSCPQRASGGDAEVMTVAVAPTVQGCGVGRALLEALIEAARRRGSGRLLLEVRADNASARNLYTAAGFEELAIRPGYYRTRAAEGVQPTTVDALVLVLPLVAGPVDSLTP